VKGVAIRYAGIVYWMPKPARHCHVGQAMIANGHPPPYPGGKAQGFILDSDTFVDRLEAARVYMEQGGQLHWPPNLYSEDLW
jgi:hypothetical protein